MLYIITVFPNNAPIHSWAQRSGAPRLQAQSTTSGGVQKKQRCIAWCRNISRRSSPKSKPGGVAGLPQFVKDEFDAFLECGILAHGFLRLRCAECVHEKLVAFSCKRRGFCPSCGARRMAETAAYLVDSVIPRVPVRQWVLSFPIPLRTLFAAHPDLLAPVLQIIHRVIATFLIQQAGVKRSEAATGAITLIQRFGSAANLNIHLHGLVLDGVYRTTGEGAPVFHQAPAPTLEQLQALLGKIIAHPEAVDPPRASCRRRGRDLSG